MRRLRVRFWSLSTAAWMALAAAVLLSSGCPAKTNNGSNMNVTPTISVQPASQSVAAGQMATFSVVASGTPPPSYQWQLNSRNISGATSSSYTTPATTVLDDGEKFTVFVTNAAGGIISNQATLHVFLTGAASITTQPLSVAVAVGQSATFTVSAAGTAPLSYQWLMNGANIPGANSASYMIAAALYSSGGEKFSVKVSNAAGSATSAAATLTVNPSPAVDVLTYHNDLARTGQNLNEIILTPSSVKAATFGKIGFFSVDGLVDAQPLYLSNVTLGAQGTHDVLYVATENDSVYAFDAITGDVLWQVSMLGTGETPSDDRGCGQVTPKIGITSTPVIDRSRGPNGAMYLVAMSKNGSGTYFQRVHALDITTGAELFGGPATIQAQYPGTGANSNGANVIFDPAQYKERTGLLELNGIIYTMWASHCDDSPYTGWLMGFDAGTLALGTSNILNVTPNGSDGAIWASGAAPAADSSGNFYVLDGNGTFDTSLTGVGFPSQGDFGNAFLKFSTAGALKVADYFEMFNQGSENGSDVDLGSGGAMVLPDLTDATNKTWHLAIGAGKDSNIYVANRDSMGGFNSNTNNIYQELAGALPGGIWSMPAYFNGTVYFGPVSNALLAFSISNAKLSATPVATPNSFAYPGVTPGVSAHGTSNAIVWAVENSGGAGILHAYDATNVASEFYNSTQGANGQFSDNKFITPTVANGRVYIGTPTGVVVFGLLP